MAVRVENLAEVRRALRQAGDDMTELKDANARVAAFVAKQVARTAPKRSGRLAGSIRGNRAQRKATIRSSLIYAPVINYGWPGHNIEAQHFAERGAEQSRPQWQAMYEHELRKLAAKAERVTA